MEYKGSIVESYTLPSLGKLNGIDPTFLIRSMTTQEEKRRLSTSEMPNKLMADIIKDCLSECNFNPYDLCMQDYFYLLCKLRTVTYGSKYVINVPCRYCGNVEEEAVNLDELDVIEYDDEKLREYLQITLPRSKDVIDVKLVTPRDSDFIARRAKEISSKQTTNTGDPRYLLEIQYRIDKINGETISIPVLEQYVRNMPAMDAKVLLRTVAKVPLGIQVNGLEHTCSRCGGKITYTLPITNEFFDPQYL